MPHTYYMLTAYLPHTCYIRTAYALHTYYRVQTEYILTIYLQIAAWKTHKTGGETLATDLMPLWQANDDVGCTYLKVVF